MDAEYLRDIEKARRSIRALISSKQCAPILLRLALHDAATYEAKTKTVGPNGSIRNCQELKDAANAGLKNAVELLEPIKAKCQKISYADLYQLAGLVAVEVSGGPTIDFVPGRKDSLNSPEEGRLSDANQGLPNLKDFGLSKKDIVALHGAEHLLNFEDKSSTTQPLQFDNSYFVELLKGENNDLLKDDIFKEYAEKYAKDENEFFKDYAEAHKKLSELGFAPPTTPANGSCKPDSNPGMSIISQAAMGVAFGTAILLFAYFFDISRKIRS